MAGVSAEVWSVGAPRRGVVTAVRTREQEFSDTVALWHRELARHAYVLCGDGPTAEDVVAEAVAKVWPRWRKGQVDDLVPYIRQTIVHEVYGRHRRLRLVRREAARPSPPPLDGQFESGVTERAALWEALATLPYDQRVVVVLRVVEDLSEQQVADMLGVAIGTVKSRLSRGLAALRTAVGSVDA